ncbi:MAG: GNAT family N-acetyltransferase [Clostridia bacterium]|nr:GNAT family N-acetyltransferase [Clostridia bacterium]
MMEVLTDRLYLRSFTAKDAESALAWLGDAEAMRYIEPVFDVAKAEAFIRTCGHLVYCLCLRESGLPIGHVIWHPFMGQKDKWELGWIFAPEYWGRGYAREISKALIEKAREEGICEIVLEAVPENVASIRVIEALGAAYSHTDGDGLAVWHIVL